MLGCVEEPEHALATRRKVVAVCELVRLHETGGEEGSKRAAAPFEERNRASNV